jgi:hypothetical protein
LVVQEASCLRTSDPNGRMKTAYFIQFALPRGFSSTQPNGPQQRSTAEGIEIWEGKVAGQYPRS